MAAQGVCREEEAGARLTETMETRQGASERGRVLCPARPGGKGPTARRPGAHGADPPAAAAGGCAAPCPLDSPEPPPDQAPPPFPGPSPVSSATLHPRTGVRNSQPWASGWGHPSNSGSRAGPRGLEKPPPVLRDAALRKNSCEHLGPGNDFLLLGAQGLGVLSGTLFCLSTPWPWIPWGLGSRPGPMAGSREPTTTRPWAQAQPHLVPTEGHHPPAGHGLSESQQGTTCHLSRLLLPLFPQPVPHSGSSGYGSLGSNGSHEHLMSQTSSSDSAGQEDPRRKRAVRAPRPPLPSTRDTGDRAL